MTASGLSAHRVVFVGDAGISFYEIMVPGGPVARWNEEPGKVRHQRVLGHVPKAIWLNPLPEAHGLFT